MPLPLKLESAPPETVTSETVKVVEASLRAKVMVAVLPKANAEELLEIAIDGAMVSGVLKFSVVVLLMPA